jgi:hypothetical protein
MNTATYRAIKAIKDRYIDGHVQRRVDQVRVGDRVDFKGDEYADKGDNSHPEFDFEFAIVESVERETPNCIRIDTTQGSFGFPPDHWLDVDGEQVR